MPTSTTYPNGQTLTSSALTQSEIDAALQTLTCGVLGINPPNYSIVKIVWPTEGQPFTKTPAQNCCYLSCVTSDSDYSRVRDRVLSTSGAQALETWLYTRNWRVNWTVYGPDSTDWARMIHSATFMEYFNSALAAYNLYPVEDPPEPTRLPEQFNAQWWERSDFHIDMYEQVTETILDGVATSVEIKLYNGSTDDPVADVTVTK